MSNIVPLPSQIELKQLHKLLHKYKKHIDGEQGLAGEVIGKIMDWIAYDIEPKEGENSYRPRYDK